LGIEVTLQIPGLNKINLKVKVTVEEISAKVKFKMFVKEQKTYYGVSLTEDPLLALNVEFYIGEKEKYKSAVEAALKKVLTKAVSAILVDPNGKVFPLNVRPLLVLSLSLPFPPDYHHHHHHPHNYIYSCVVFFLLLLLVIRAQHEIASKKSRKHKKKIGRVVVTVQEATNLAVADRNGLSDPYCVVRVGTSHGKTKVVQKNLNPKWNQTIVLDVFEGAVELVLLVYDHDRFSRDEFLGEVVVPLTKLQEQDHNGPERLQSNQHNSNGISVQGSLSFTARLENEGSYKEDQLTSILSPFPIFPRFYGGLISLSLSFPPELSTSKSMDIDKVGTLSVIALGIEGDCTSRALCCSHFLDVSFFSFFQSRRLERSLPATAMVSAIHIVWLQWGPNPRKRKSSPSP